MAEIFAYEKVAVVQAAKGLTASVYAPATWNKASLAAVAVEDIAVRWRADGADPTATEGLLAAPGALLKLEGGDVARFRAYAPVGTASLKVAYLRGGTADQMPVQASSGTGGSGYHAGQVTLTDYSGTCDGADHVVVAANPDRKALLIQAPLSNGTSFWINWGVAAVMASPSVEFPGGEVATLGAEFCPLGAVHVIGLAGVVYTLKEG